MSRKKGNMVGGDHGRKREIAEKQDKGMKDAQRETEIEGEM